RDWSSDVCSSDLGLRRIGCVLDQESRGIQQLVRRQILAQGLFPVVMGTLGKVGAPLRHGFVQGSDFSSPCALGVAFLAGLAEIVTSFVLAPLLSGTRN